MTDLILRGGRVIDPASGRDETADIAFGDGKVTEIGRDLPASGSKQRLLSTVTMLAPFSSSV